MNPTQRILVLDDDRDSGQLVSDAAEAMGMTCLATTDPMTFLDWVTPDTRLIFLDLALPVIDGVELLRMLSRRECSANIVLMSGADTRVLETTEEWGKTLGLTIIGYLQKPVRLADLEVILGNHQPIPRQ
jgi:DNA-binding response OmpR family regulator